MRGVCALTVFLYHLIPLHGHVRGIGHGYIAVDTFFMISGFVIASSYEQRLRNGMSIISFLRARVRRLGPVYWLGLVLGAICWGFILIALNHTRPELTIPALLRLVVLESLLIPALGSSLSAFTLNTPAWSIFGEVVVNLLYARTIRWLNLRMLVVIVCAGWLATALIAMRSPDHWNFGWSGDAILVSLVRATPAFAMGVLLYRLSISGWLSRLPALPAFLPMGIWCSLAVTPNLFNPVFTDAISVTVITPVLIACLIRAREPASGWHAQLGHLSYPLYLCQMPVILMANAVSPAWNAWQMVLLGASVAAVTLALAYFVAAWLEPPLSEPGTARGSTEGVANRAEALVG